jgi:small subunit ribosomal protein S6
MIDYEILLMLDPELPEERSDQIIARMRERIEADKGVWAKQEPWGRRKLAYEIDHKGEGVYHLLTFTAEPETLTELARLLKITDGVMRHLAVRRIEPGPGTAVAPPPEPVQDVAEPATASVEEE